MCLRNFENHEIEGGWRTERVGEGRKEMRNMRIGLNRLGKEIIVQREKMKKEG